MTDAHFPTSPQPPQWVENEADEISGLDLLALRAPVNAIGYRLLNGVTTISPTVRYISFRAWITHVYGQLRLPDPQREFLEFAHRIECAVVVGNLLANSEASGLIGSDKAHRIIEEATDNIELCPLVKQPATNIYLGPSQQIGVVIDRGKGIWGLSEERGQLLAELVDKALSTTKFAERLKRNPGLTELSQNELEEIGRVFPMSSPNEEERDALVSAILPDSPRSAEENHRIASYGILLEIADAEGRLDELDIFEHAVAPESSLLRRYRKWLDGWACYLIRDMLAIVHEAALETLLYALQEVGNGVRPVNGIGLVRDLLTRDDELTAAIKDVGLLPAHQRPLDSELEELAIRMDKQTETAVEGMIPRWSGLKEQDVIGVARRGGVGALAMLPCAWLLARVRVMKGIENKDLVLRSLSIQGWNRIGMDQVVLPSLEDMLGRKIGIREAIFELAMRTVDQHVRIAWSRFAADPRRDVGLLTVDDGLWALKAKEEFKGGRTASRLLQAIGWMRQLGLIDENGCTDRGKDCLVQIRNWVDSQESQQ